MSDHTAKTADTPAPPKPPKPADSLAEFRRFGEIVIELGDDRNRNFLYPPTQQNLRGWWKKSNLIGMTMDTRMTQMPDLPGMYVILDCKRCRLRIADPLGADANKPLLQAAQAVHKEVFRTVAGPEKDLEETDLKETKLKSHLYWMRRMVDNGQARIVTGELPSMEVIEALPGYTRTEPWNSSARARKWREETDEEVATRNHAARNWA